MKKINLQLTLFPGFYETSYFSADSAYYAIKEACEFHKDELGEDVTEDDFEFDYENYEKDIVRGFVEAYKELVPSFVQNINEGEVVRPRFYNFQNDRIFCDFELSDDWYDEMVSFINSNREWFAGILEKYHKNRDGFWSFMTHDVDEWIEELKGDDECLYIAYTIGYMMWHAHNSNCDNIHDILLDLTFYHIDGNYVICTKHA